MPRRPITFAVAGALALAAVIPLAGTRCPSARAEDALVDETEQRLKAAGVDGGLRASVRTTIDRGVQFLLKRQASDGSFAESCSADAAKSFASEKVGVTLLCAHALQHAGTAAARSPCARAVDWTFPASGAPRPELKKTYAASLALMVLASIPGHDADARRIAADLVALQNPRSGWWGYDGVAPEPSPYAGDLSNSQFAVLGLRAAMTRKIPVPEEVWIRHAVSLCDQQTKAGSWPYSLNPSDAVDRHAAPVNKPTLTLMGLAGLWIAKAVLEQSDAMPAELRPRVDAALRRGRALVEPDIAVMLGFLKPKYLETPSGIEFQPGWWFFYPLFSLEKACIFGQVQTLNGAPWHWYADMARLLVAIQKNDGGWGPIATPKKSPSSEVDTALALLFLEQSVSVFNVTTVSGDAPPTPSKEPPKTGDPSPPMDR